MTTLETAEDFLSQKRLALVGVSRQEKEFSRMLFREFLKRGYDAVPVTLSAEEIDGRRCFARVQEITPPVDGALIMTPAKTAESVVMDCATAGISRVWLYRATGEGAASKAAISFCKAKGMQVVPGSCPFLFWKDAPFFHRIHAFIVKLTGGVAR